MIERRACLSDDHSIEHAPVPLADVWTAQTIAGRVHREVVFHVRRAREAGHSWDEFGQSLGLESVPELELTRAGAAFEHVTNEPDTELISREATFGWRCCGCDQLIWDFGLYDADPADCETGHAERCPRPAIVVERWRALWEHSAWDTRTAAYLDRSSPVPATSPPPGNKLASTNFSARRRPVHE